jgi:ABC-2 type transport system permease protein
MKNYFHTVLVMCKMLSLRYLRDKVALFFTFLFPIMFLLIFGSLNRGSGDVHFNIALINHSHTTIANQFVQQVKTNKAFKIHQGVTSVEVGKEQMGRGELDSVIELPSDFGEPGPANLPGGRLVVYYQASNPETGHTLSGVMQQILDRTNRQLIQQVVPFSVQQKSTSTLHLTRFDYVFAGMLGFTVISLGIFGMANGFPVEKRAGRLRRMRATPLRASQLILATALEYLLIGLASSAAMFVVAMLVFHLHMRGDYLSLVGFTILGTLLMFGFGLAIGGWAKNENQAAPLANLVTFPMMFLSGVFFPRFLMPEWLANITAYLPLTPVIDGLRMIVTEGKTLLQLGPELLVMAIWTFVIYALAIRIFRWE